ncbi:MAG: GNAT family N-acetyltransferase [Candidatus Obscuribacterales bacterium]|nr:GNAT family N-acetyltransferase [Candidatus Obscuribacterales bacterium]
MTHDLVAHYTEASESTRLTTAAGRLEFERTVAILKQQLPPAPATVLDVGGAAGVYAVPLAQAGYTVHLIDPVPKHVQQAVDAFAAARLPGATSSLGDARALSQENGSVDAVLMLGPLYHLTSQDDRRLALDEAYRVLRPGGVVIAAAISRFASTIDGVSRNLFDDPIFKSIVERDLKDGQHRNPTNNPEYFTDSFFHLPSELKEEISGAGFVVSDLSAVEGPFWMLPGLADWMEQPKRQALLMELLNQTASHENLIGMSAHVIATGRKPTLETRLCLKLKSCEIRTWSADDVESLAANANDKDIAANLRDTFPHPYSAADARRWIALCSVTEPRTNFAIAVDGKAVGSIGVMPQTDVSRKTAEIGYWLGKNYWGKGIVSEALEAFSNWCFAEFGLVRLFANAYETNTASARVLEKAGFQREALLRNAAFKNGKVQNELLFGKILDRAE